MACTSKTPLHELEVEDLYLDMTAVKIKNSLNFVFLTALKVSYLYTQNGKKCVYNLYSKDTPIACTRLSNSRVAVAYPHNNAIVLLKPTPTKLTIWASMTTDKKYTGLGSMDSQRFWALGYLGNRTSLDLLDIRGRVLSTVRYHDDFIKPASYLAYTSIDDTVVISMYSDEPVKFVKRDGSVRLCLQEDDVGNSLEKVMGVAVDDETGKVYLADKHLHRVVEVSDKGRTFRSVLTADDGVKIPSFITICDGKFIVGSMDDSIVQVYDMKPLICPVEKKNVGEFKYRSVMRH